MSDNYKVSIITACYNSEKTIERTLKSVLAQTYSNFLMPVVFNNADIQNSILISIFIIVIMNIL